MDCCDAAILVILNHLWPVDASVVNIDLSLYVEYASDSGLHHGLSIRLELRIWPDKYSGVSNLVESKSTDKVGISLVTVSVDNVSLAHIPPDI